MLILYPKMLIPFKSFNKLHKENTEKIIRITEMQMYTANNAAFMVFQYPV